jgi:hypothetical protein
MRRPREGRLSVLADWLMMIVGISAILVVAAYLAIVIPPLITQR